MKYNAFISYSHRKDSLLAPHLQKSLEKFAKPLFKRKALSLFRDANDLSASPDLWGNIEEGLNESEYFIFLASPLAAESKWCKKELEFWLKNKSADKLLIALTDGEMAWDDSKNDFDWLRTDAVPKVLSGVFKNEPMFVDFRGQPVEKELNLQNPDFKAKTVLIAATLHGKSVDDMTGEGIRQHRRNLRLRNGAILVLSLLLAASVLLSIYAFDQRNKALENQAEAEKQKKEALLNANKALAKSYLSDSKSKSFSNPTLSLKLAAYGYSFSKTFGLPEEDFSDQMIKAYNSADGFYMNTKEDDVYYDNKGYEDSLREYEGNVLEVQNGELVMHRSDGKEIIYNGNQIFDPETFTFVKGSACVLVRFKEYHAREVSQHLAVLDYDGTILADLRTLQPYVPPFVKFSKKGDRLIISDMNEARMIQLGNTPYDRWSVELKGISENINAASISPNGDKVVLGRADGSIELTYILSRYKKFTKKLIGHEGEVIRSLNFSENGKVLFSESSQLKRKWNAEITTPYFQIPNPLSMENYYLYDPDTYLIDSSYQFLWNPETRSLMLFNAKEDSIYFEELYYFNRGDTTANGKYYANMNGMYNRKNEKLISFNITISQGSRYILPLCFSKDDNFLIANDKIYCLNEKRIMAEVNSIPGLGKSESFSLEERVRYLIINHVNKEVN